MRTDILYVRLTDTIILAARNVTRTLTISCEHRGHFEAGIVGIGCQQHAMKISSSVGRVQAKNWIPVMKYPIAAIDRQYTGTTTQRESEPRQNNNRKSSRRSDRRRNDCNPAKRRKYRITNSFKCRLPTNRGKENVKRQQTPDQVEKKLYSMACVLLVDAPWSLCSPSWY